MLDGCHPSCVAAMNVNEHEQCAEWASQGVSNFFLLWFHDLVRHFAFSSCQECSRNPKYMELSCTLSCGAGYVWSPVVRRELGLSNLPFVPAPQMNESPTNERNLPLDSALAAGARLGMLFDGGSDPFGLPADNLWGLSVSVGEALLYTATTASLAARNFETNVVEERSLSLARRVADLLGQGADSVHRNALPFWRELQRGVFTNPRFDLFFT
jgi:hypothetical protein